MFTYRKQAKPPLAAEKNIHPEQALDGDQLLSALTDYLLQHNIKFVLAPAGKYSGSIHLCLNDNSHSSNSLQYELEDSHYALRLALTPELMPNEPVLRAALTGYARHRYGESGWFWRAFDAVLSRQQKQALRP